jgi:primosomal protein N'
VLEAAERYAALLRGFGQAEVLGPAPYPIARINDEWRYRIALKAGDAESLRVEIRERLQPLARADRNTRLVVNVDP